MAASTEAASGGRRGFTARTLLEPEWRYPAYAADGFRPQRGQSHARTRRVALPRADALAYIAGDDLRPLLVLRECRSCDGTNDALLTDRLDDEKTVLLSMWFHMVRLPSHVLEDDHPFRNLFDEGQPSHLFLTTVDGSSRIRLSGRQSQTELWNGMETILETAYGSDPGRSIRSAFRILDELDEVDRRELDLRRRSDRELERKGPRSARYKRLQRDLEAASDDRTLLVADFRKELRMSERTR